MTMDNVYFIFGADEFFVDLKAKKVLEKYADIPLETFDGKMGTIADLTKTLGNCIESLRTLDFFSTQKCVWLRATNLFSANGPGTTEGAQPHIERWLEVLKTLPQDVIMLISASPVDKRIRLFKTLQELAVCDEMEDKKTDDYLRFLLQKLSQELQVTIAEDAAQLLLQKMNHQPRAVANEFKKLACIKNFSGKISPQEVLSYTPTLPNDEFFEPVEAFYEKNTERYVHSLRNHFILNKEMRSILSMMQNRNRLLIQLSALSLPTVSKATLERQYFSYEADFGLIRDKNSFCVFSQNPWYLSRLRVPFSLPTLLRLQQEFIVLFDQILAHPQQACAWMESLVRFF